CSSACATAMSAGKSSSNSPISSKPTSNNPPLPHAPTLKPSNSARPSALHSLAPAACSKKWSPNTAPTPARPSAPRTPENSSNTCSSASPNSPPTPPKNTTHSSNLPCSAKNAATPQQQPKP